MRLASPRIEASQHGRTVPCFEAMDSPREAIVADITRPPVPGKPATSPGPGSPARWSATTYQGGHPFQARPETIRFLKETVQGELALLAVEFKDTEGRPWRYVFGARQQGDRTWRAAGAAGGGGGPELRRAEPWANFGGWGWPRFLCLGGRVHGDRVRTVRLTDAEGLTVEDTVENGYAVLLVPEPVRLPCQIALLDSTGVVLAIQPWPPGRRP